MLFFRSSSGVLIQEYGTKFCVIANFLFTNKMMVNKHLWWMTPSSDWHKQIWTESEFSSTNFETTCKCSSAVVTLPSSRGYRLIERAFNNYKLWWNLTSQIWHGWYGVGMNVVIVIFFGIWVAQNQKRTTHQKQNGKFSFLVSHRGSFLRSTGDNLRYCGFLWLLIYQFNQFSQTITSDPLLKTFWSNCVIFSYFHRTVSVKTQKLLIGNILIYRTPISFI